jgi:hypothetical protein
MTIEHIHEGGLNDDLLYISDENKIFKGGYKAIFEYWTFQNSWSNKKNIRSFRTLENAYKFINKNFNH